ncbi:hypothetical protein LMG22037_05533 [Paraburkholderia phenoliruptrix]|uniref:VWFA domain-containing protein n=2 Tax=Paraburkholderia phenoliruptrix TaxID=252970 RepID=A0A6J5C956_9BURK|nr:VWA domain-containing protein [Paraburkholderia phenoliruptrix]CAB3730457.1 hypothetical protein LMG22037_05533 [Paraburkholderia phenoliruptrix]
MRNLMLLARMLANRHNLEVEVNPKADNASTTRKKLTLPGIWVDAVLPTGYPQITELLEGVIDHLAAGHARHTDFDAYDACMAHAGPLKSSILGIFEDLRVERLAAEVYPGIARNLARTVELLVPMGFFGQIRDIGHARPAQGLVEAMLCVGRATLLRGQDAPLRDLARAYEVWIRAQCPTLWLHMMDIIRRAWSASSTGEVVTLVDEAMQLLGDLATGDTIARDATPSSCPDSSSGGADDTDCKRDGQGGPASAIRGEEDAAAATEAPGEAATQSPSDVAVTTQEQRFALSVLVQQDVRQADMGDMVGEALGGAVSALPADTRMATKAAGTRKLPLPPTWIATAGRIRGRLGRDFEALLESRKDANRHVGFVGRRLQSNRIHRLVVLDGRVFRRRRVEDEINACVSLLIDVSGSMGVKSPAGFVPLEAAGGTLVALAELLELHEIPFAAAVFNARVCTIKQFGESWKRVSHCAQSIPVLGGTTALAPALQSVLTGIADRDEARRLVVVVLDGRTPDMEQVAALYSDAQEMGIEIATVLIAKTGDRYVAPYAEMLRKFGRQPSLTDSMDTLAKTIIDEVRSLI